MPHHSSKMKLTQAKGIGMQEEVEQNVGSGGKGPPQTAGEIVDRANRAIEAGKSAGPPKNGGVSGSEADPAEDSRFADVRERVNLTAQRLSELSGDAKVIAIFAAHLAS